MKGISSVVTSSALILVAVGLLVMVMPWIWTAVSQALDTSLTVAQTERETLLSDVRFLLPPAVNPNNTDQVLVIHNSGMVPLHNVRIKMIDNDFEIYELNFYVVRKNGALEGSKDSPLSSINTFYPGDLAIVRVPARSNYLGYIFALESDRYFKSVEVGE